MATINIKNKYKENVIKDLLDKFKYENIMSVPKIEKIVINRGLGEAVSNSKLIYATQETMTKMTGQQATVTFAKKSISNFKIREKMPIGCRVTLRGDKMYDFLTKLINIALPAIRDFRGLNERSFDGDGNYNFGISDEIVFPEIKIDGIDRVRGFNITIVTSADNDVEGLELLKLMGVPFRTK